MDWFEKLTGFREAAYHATRDQLEVLDGELRSRVNGLATADGAWLTHRLRLKLFPLIAACDPFQPRGLTPPEPASSR